MSGHGYGAAVAAPSPAPATAAGATFRRVTEGSWRLLGLGLVVLVVGALLWTLRIVVLPVFIATLLCSVLAPLVVRLEGRGWRPLPATVAVFFGFLGVLGLALTAIIPPTVDELGGLGDTVEIALDDIEDWLVDGPLSLDRSDVEEITDDPGGRLSELARSSGSQLADGARLVGETLAGALLALVLTFLFLKDGRRIQRWWLSHLPDRHRELARDAAARALGALAGFLRGAALLGLVEGVTIRSRCGSSGRRSQRRSASSRSWLPSSRSSAPSSPALSQCWSHWLAVGSGPP